MFAMVHERDPMSLADIPGGLNSWVQSAGGWAAAGVALWLLLGYTRLRPIERGRIRPLHRTVFLLGTAISVLSYVLAFVAWIVSTAVSNPHGVLVFRSICLTAGGAAAIAAAGLPFFTAFTELRFRRIWALTKLSFKEAIRSRVLYAFFALLLVFLFASWFISAKQKAENELRTYVTVVYGSMSLLLLVAAVILTAFSIPRDIRQQTIHTIVTKPVERFEILLGRFLGYTALMTLVLLLITTLSVVYVLRGISQEAREESLKARDPLYGILHFENTGNENRGGSVGREWEYRSYITTSAPNRPPEYAIWDFPSPPSSLAGRKTVRCEFTFDIYRTHKGYENRGISCQFQFQSANYDRGRHDDYVRERSRLLNERGPSATAAIDDQLAEEYGYYDVPAKDVTDYHTQFVDVPAGLFRNAMKASSSPARPGKGSQPPPAIQVRVSVSRHSMTQYIGMAKYDLYWRLDDPERGGDRAAFTYNFYKGVFGLWMRLCLVIGISVALSTYLSGVISMLVTGMLYLGGGARDYIQSIGQGTAPGGGPMEALVRMANRQIALVPLEDSPSAKVADVFDIGFRWFINRVLDIVPDVDRFVLTNYVGEGFNIPAGQLLLDFGALALYLLPWVVLAYYLMKWREIAAPT